MKKNTEIPTRKRETAASIRAFRKIHRQTAIILFVAFFIMALTGILLGWKKNSGGLILAKTETGSTTGLAGWLPLDSLHRIAAGYVQDSLPGRLSAGIDRMEIRPDKGVVKITFSEHYKGLQLDGATGRILKVEHRYADLLEHIHDGSVIDRLLHTGNGIFKLIYTSMMGIALLVFVVTGVWLWRGPAKLRREKLHQRRKMIL